VGLPPGEAQHCWLLSEGRQNNKKIPKNNVEKSINDDLDEVEALPVTGKIISDRCARFLLYSEEKTSTKNVN
jgi:hypothetical protein